LLGASNKIKDMSPEEQVRYFNESTKETVEKFGIKVGTPADKRKSHSDILIDEFRERDNVAGQLN
jgi:hypothetical protein